MTMSNDDKDDRWDVEGYNGDTLAVEASLEDTVKIFQRVGATGLENVNALANERS